VPVDSSVYWTLFNLPELYCRDYGYTTDASLPACYNSLIYDRADQKEALKPLVNWLKKKIKKSGDRVRAAASLVQNIPYDDNKATGREIEPTGRKHGPRYPYETLYDNTGICGEKSSLIVYLLKQLGYGTATMTFASPAHEVAGVKCPPAYDFRDTGYCIIQPNYRKMITWEGSQKDKDPYQIMILSDGKTFNAKKDYKDSRDWWKVLREGTASNKNYKLYKKLVKKYGL